MRASETQKYAYCSEQCAFSWSAFRLWRSFVFWTPRFSQWNSLNASLTEWSTCRSFADLSANKTLLSQTMPVPYGLGVVLSSTDRHCNLQIMCVAQKIWFQFWCECEVIKWLIAFIKLVGICLRIYFDEVCIMFNIAETLVESFFGYQNFEYQNFKANAEVLASARRAPGLCIRIVLATS